MSQAFDESVRIPVDGIELEGNLAVPEGWAGLVIFAHGSGSSRKSPRNNFVAEVIRERNLGTLLFDLLTEEEDQVRENRFDITLLTERLIGATRWVRENDRTPDASIGYFGSSTGAAAALRAAAQLDDQISAVVSRGGRVDLAADVLSEVQAATLFIVGGADTEVLALNRDAFEQLPGQKDLHVVPDAGHLFEGEGELDEVADVAASWFANTLR